MADSVRSSNASDSGDTSLSEFLAKRYNGSIPVFGGSVRTGAQELGNAASSDIVRAVSGLTGALNRFVGYKGAATGVPQQDRITMADLSSELVSVDDAVNLDDSKIEMLLSASMIDPRDTKRYISLMAAARTSLIRKRDAIILHEQRKTARVSHRPIAHMDELTFDEDAKQRLVKMYKIFDIPNDPYVDCDYNRVMLMSITHESVFQGRETNRVLAHLGDSVLKMVAAQYCFDTKRPVSDVSDMVQATQTDAHLSALAKKKGLDNIVIVGSGIDVAAKKIMATVMEAIVGALYYLQGDDATTILVNQLGIVDMSDVTPTI